MKHSAIVGGEGERARWSRCVLAWLSCALAGCGVAPAPDGGAVLDGGTDAGPPPPPRAAERPFTQYVDPFIGTGGIGFSVGSAYPGPATPNGMVHPGPDTENGGSAPGFAHCAGYWWSDDTIRGFSHTRMHGTGISDYGAVALMPTDGMSADKTRRAGYVSRYSHDTEEASPGYYAVTLEDTGIRVELTATDHVGLHRYTFPAGADPVVLFDLGYFMADNEVIAAEVEIDPVAHEISGMHHVSGGYSERFGGVPVYFAARFSRPFVEHGVWDAGVVHEGETRRTGTDAGAYLRFDGEDPVVAAVGISFIDVAHARASLDAEASPLDFDATRAATLAAWEALLGRVEIEARSEAALRTFYTALYHALLMPTLATEPGGAYRGLDGEVHTADGFRYYTDFSLWDTYRTLHPLLTLIYPELQLDFLKSLAAMAADGGYMPRWPLGIGYTGGMLGEPAAIVFADSVLKGVDDFDVRAAYDAFMATALGPTPEGAAYSGRRGIEEYLALGYVPIEAGGSSASWTLEMAYADHGLAVLAEHLGEAEDAAAFAERAQSYRAIYDDSTGFLLGRHADGTFPELGDRGDTVWQDYYSEGNAWQYNWFVPHDLAGLAELMGGPAPFLARLGDFFERTYDQRRMPIAPDPYYWHGNEPDIHAPFAFAALGAPAETADAVRWIVATRYGDDQDGLPGNDDGGTLSAWYVLSALGVFPIAALPHYILSGPLVTRATVHLPGGDLIIEAPASSDRDRYVQSVTFDGAPIDIARIDHDELAAGGTLRFEMASEPSDWATR